MALHCNRHCYAGYRILLHAPRFRIAKEYQYGVANEFVDRRTVLESDLTSPSDNG
jgi:hypothetical protein